MMHTLQGPVIPPFSGKKPLNVVVMLHGLGAEGSDLVDLGRVWAPIMPDTLFLFPDAPFSFDGGMSWGRQWFSMRDQTIDSMRAGIEASAPFLSHYIDENLQTSNALNTQLALVGFSQGAAMALHVGLRRKPACIVGFSGGVFDEEPEVPLEQPPVLLVHGDRDDVLPITYMHAAQRYLRSRGIEAETYTCCGLGHSINREGMDVASAFIKKHLYIIS